ncbi:hypothetical protein F2Q68_00046506 [Brassica cretica]|uniref:Uncharacterized protein n=2 Tax=Brassica cretica TaxID=69181 RepID=A0A8S9Q2Q6_BRACR|nr:hypothetical protein F2Q68_00046506 [Brassica cretica]KAF3515717.1 hypothetical protein DY000_02064008 [Brassica cretica]KAF3524956.1 hypothetical protein F2Q69_00051671 [Brassica cretica]
MTTSMIRITRHSGRLIKELYAICDSFIVVYVRGIVRTTAGYLRRLKPLSLAGVLMSAGGARKSEVDEPHENLSELVEELHDDDPL